MRKIWLELVWVFLDVVLVWSVQVWLQICFATKIYCSSLGQNLETSPYIWENAFAVSISIIGLILFLYLIGNLQVCIDYFFFSWLLLSQLQFFVSNLFSIMYYRLKTISRLLNPLVKRICLNGCFMSANYTDFSRGFANFYM